ncbi:unnamed protein product, partial [Bubo scandiacus]
EQGIHVRVWKVHLCGSMWAPGSVMKPAHTAWSRTKKRSDATELPDVWLNGGMTVGCHPCILEEVAWEI